MRIPLVTTALALSLATPTLAASNPYISEVRNCQPTQEEFLRAELRAGQKIVAFLGQIDTVHGYLVRWDSGSYHIILAGPAEVDGDVKFCTLAWKYLFRDEGERLASVR